MYDVEGHMSVHFCAILTAIGFFAIIKTNTSFILHISLYVMCAIHECTA